MKNKIIKFLSVMQGIIFPLVMLILMWGVIFQPKPEYTIAGALGILTIEICALKFKKRRL